MSIIAATAVVIHARVRIGTSLHRSNVVFGMTLWSRAWLKVRLVENGVTLVGLVRLRLWNTFESSLDFIVVEAVFGGHRDLPACLRVLPRPSSRG